MLIFSAQALEQLGVQPRQLEDGSGGEDGRPFADRPGSDPVREASGPITWRPQGTFGAAIPVPGRTADTARREAPPAITPAAEAAPPRSTRDLAPGSPDRGQP